MLTLFFIVIWLQIGIISLEEILLHYWFLRLLFWYLLFSFIWVLQLKFFHVLTLLIRITLIFWETTLVGDLQLQKLFLLKVLLLIILLTSKRRYFPIVIVIVVVVLISLIPNFVNDVSIKILVSLFLHRYIVIQFILILYLL